MDVESGANIPVIKVYPDKFSGQINSCDWRCGAQVILVDIQEPGLQQIQASSEEREEKARYRVCDITNEQRVQDTLAWVVSNFHEIDVLAHIAGIYPFHPLRDYPTEIYRRTMTVNVDASFFLTRAILPFMDKVDYGRIILTSSSTIQEPEEGLSAYVTAKMAVVGLARAASIEASSGVTVNVVSPGLVKTDRVWSSGVQPDGSHPLFEHVVKKQTIKRWGRPEDIVHTFCFIASPEASFITGQFFDVSGGETFH